MEGFNMILVLSEDSCNVFTLETKSTGYIFQVTKHGHLEHIYYGSKLTGYDLDGLRRKRTVVIGSSIVYHPDDPLYTLDTLPLEWSGIGRGDYRFSPAELKMPDGSFVCDFIYKSHKIHQGCLSSDKLPSAYGKEGVMTLEILLEDDCTQVEASLFYTVFEESDVISRKVILTNNNASPLTIRRLMSMCVDLPNENFRMITFDGGWIKETHRHDHLLQYGMAVNSSTTGGSSNRHNPGFLLASSDTNEDRGNVYGFNLIYSGNHMGCAELSERQLVRICLGINPHCFEWVLAQGESFETPEAVMTYSASGFNGMSHNFHSFVNHHIIRGEWKGKERPVLINNWEAHFFKFNQKKLLRLAKRAKKLGVELFVLDDGWFGNRNNDHAGLGDYTVNRKKLPHGLSHFARKLKKLGLDFGLWFEPEMVNPDSDLFRLHPEYAITIPGRAPTLGRNQLVLDLCNPKVRDYIVSSVSHILDDADISYVKWDMNRHISEAFSPCIENQGEFFHRYILGLYDILSRIFNPRPHILLESCSSGGNRFDLGLLCYSPQIWASDDTDPIERLKIVSGLSYLYPLSTIGAHVSEAPHQQTLRETPISTRFNVSCFGALGYEMDLKYLSSVEKKEIKEQIAFYKKYRKLFQYGHFSRIETGKANKIQWQCTAPDKNCAVTGFFQTQSNASEAPDLLRIPDLAKERRYNIQTKPQRLFIKRFGGLVKHILPIELNPGGTILRLANRYYALQDCVEHYKAGGDTLAEGLFLNDQFMGSYYNSQTRLLGDFGSNLYIVESEVEQ